MEEKNTEQLQIEIVELTSQLKALKSNISEYKEIEERYRKNEKRYKEAQALGKFGSWEYNIKTGNFWGSDEAKKIYGFQPDSVEFTTDEVEGCIPDRVRIHQALIDLIENDKKYDLEFDIITKDQSKRKTIHSIAEMEIGSDGKPYKVTGLITDITSSKQAEQNLKESEERFKFLSEATFEGIVVHNRGIISDANDSFVKMTGYNRDEVIGKNLLDYIPRLKDRAKILMNITKRKTEPYIVSAKRYDGSRLTVELEAKNITRSGKQLRIAAVRDISKRVQAEKNADEIRKRYQNIFNSAPISIWEEDFSEAFNYIESLKLKGVKDFEKFFRQNPQEVAICSQKIKILDVNKTTLSMFKASSKKDFLKNLAFVFTEDSLITFREQLIKMANKEIFYEGKCINKTFDGRLLNVYLKWNTVPGYEKDYSRVLVSLIDETEKEKTLELLQNSQKQMTAIMNDPATFLGIIEPDGTLLSANDSALEFIGKSISELKGMKFWKTPWWTHSKELQSKLRSSIREAVKGNTTHFDADHRREDGQKIFVNFSVRPVTNSQNIIDSLIVEGLDMTKQKLAEEKINNLLTEKEILLHEVHHRIKNNMATVESLFKIKSMMSKDEKIQTAFQEAISRLRSMRVLYDKLYRSSDFRNISLPEFLPGLVKEIVEVYPEGSEVVINTKIDDITVPADINFPVCIIINELLTNSMKYAFNNSKAKKKISVKAEITKSIVVITIQDNGTGLPAGFDIENSEGYGMKLVTNLAKQIKGNISYETGNGTKWVLEFDR